MRILLHSDKEYSRKDKENMDNNKQYRQTKGYADVKEEAAMVKALREDYNNRVYSRKVNEIDHPDWLNPYPQPVDLPPLHWAAYDGQKEAAESLIKGGEDVNAEDKYGRTPLHIAVERNNVDLVNFLIEKGADIEADDEHGRTPLHVAKSAEVAKALLEKGADIEADDGRGYTPLHYAKNKEIAEVLIEAGANVNAQDAWGFTPLWAVLDRCDFNCEELSVFLINAGADKNSRDYEGKTVFESLPNYKAIFNQLTDEEVLQYATRQGYTQVIPELIAKGVDVNAMDKRGKTPLEIASSNGQDDFAKSLLQNGAVDVKQLQEGPTWYDMQLEAYDQYISGGYHTQEWEDRQIAEFEEKEREREKNFPLHFAAEYGDVEKIKELLNKGVEVDGRNEEGKTALHVAAYSDSEEIVALLIASKADVNAKDEHGHTPLHYGASYKNAAVVELLLASGAKVNARSNNLDTPLHRAALFSTEAIAKLLLANGADVDSQNEDRRTALDLTRTRSNRGEVAEAIKEHIEKQKLASNKDLHVTVQNINKEGQTPIDNFERKEKERVNQRNEAGQTLLHGARSGDAAKELLKKGAEVNARTVQIKI